MLVARGDFRWENHERDLPHRSGNHIIPGDGSGGGIGRIIGDGVALACGAGSQSSVLVAATATP